MTVQRAWDGTDFAPDFRLRILNGLFPLILTCISFGILFFTWLVKRIYKMVKRRRRRRRLHTIGYGGIASSIPPSHHHQNSTQHSSHAFDNTHSRLSSHAAQSEDGDSAMFGVPVPQVIIETEAEHDTNDSHDLMLEAENAVIRAQVKEQGIVWPGAFKALGMLKEKEDHHQKPNRMPAKYLAVPGDHEVHDSDSWVQWWKAPSKTVKRQLRIFGGSKRSKKGTRRPWTWKELGNKLAKEGKKDFIQAFLSWGVVATVLFKAAFMSNTHTVWKWVPGIAWAYFTFLMEVRQYTALLHRSPFRTRKYDRLTYHVAPFMLFMSMLALLELRSVILQYSSKGEMLGTQCTATALSLVVLLMEVLAPRRSNFIRKSTLLETRSREAYQGSFGRRSPSSLSNGEEASDDERETLLPRSRLVASDSEDDKSDEDEEMLAAIDLLPEDISEDSRLDDKKMPPPPEVDASLFSLATFTYIGSFIFKHARVPATVTDVPDLRADDKSASVVLEFRAACKTYPRWLRPRSASGMRKRPPIFYEICWYMLPELVQMLSWAFVKPWATILPPIFIKLLLDWTTEREVHGQAELHVAILYIGGLFCSQMANSLCMSRALIIGRRLCIRAKALVIAEVFTKSLRRKDLAGKALVQGEKDPKDVGTLPASIHEEEGPASAGRIQNLVSVDASRIAELFAYIHFFFPEAPITIVVAVTMLFKLIGFSAFAAVGAMLCLSPYQAVVARFFMRFQNEVLEAADDRLSLTGEVFQAIKAIKFFAWERKFAEKLNDKRVKEMKALQKRVIVFAMGGVALFGAPVLIALVTFVFHTKVFHQPLTASTAFTSLALFNVIRSPLEQLADMASQLISSLVSCARVDALLAEEETAKYAIVAKPSSAGDPKIGFVNASFTWADADSAVDDPNVFKLKNLNLAFVIDGLNLVVGPVGSGKSSLLYALLGEMNLLQGRCFLPSPIVREAGLDPAEELTDTVAFCAQTPWLLNDSIRNNILFGCAYNAKRYKRVLYACALVPDLETLELGDRTEVGEKGTVLSGGQKARISLARAIYSSAKVILLDDVLSAVDAHTARHLYNNCLTSDKLMAGRTRIMVTHALHLTIPLADYMVALANGYVAFDGPAVDYIVASGANTPGLALGQDFSSLNLKSLENGFEKPPIPLDTVEDAAAEQAFEQSLPHLDEDPLNHEPLLSKTEKASTGAVSFGVYTFYGKAYGSVTVIISLVALIVVTEAVAIGTNWYLRLWASSFDRIVHAVKAIVSDSLPQQDYVDHLPDYYLKRYATFAAVSLILFGARMLYFLWRGTIASKVLYNDVLKTLLAAPVRFYDQTPNGRIMNRLSKDMETIDQDVPAGLLFFTLELFATASVIVAVAIALPLLLLGGLVVSIAYTLLGWLYISTSRELKRIEAITRSPVYSLVGESLMGVTSIRAYSDASRFTANLFNLIDDTNRPFFALWLTNRWLSIRSDLGGACFALLAASLIVFTKSISASLAGFTLTYALTMEERILWIVRLYASTQINMNSVERIREYTLELPQEPQGGREPPAHWPSNDGGIRVEKLQIRYGDNMPLALKGVSFHVKPSERVAIVGRTGSGKSTLALSFFRFVEASGGSIMIDGVDIASMPLHTLRSRLTIIPQDAALFSGTVRFNLDPFEQYSDADLYDVLRRTNLLNTRNAAGGDVPNDFRASSIRQGSTSESVNGASLKTSGVSSLDDKVQEGAKNFSAGQRQLLCLARGLLKLRESNILVLDESTANLDHETDVAVQQAIREEIGGKKVTVLCIAHRLQTIIDFDRVLVLSNGEVLEYDTPSNLLKDGEDGSEFAKLCKETGEFDKLKKIADGRASE